MHELKRHTANLGNPQRKLRRVSSREEALDPLLIVHELDMVLLGNHLGSWLLPQGHAPGVIAMAVGQDDVAHRGIADLFQQFDMARACVTSDVSMTTLLTGTL